MTDYLISVSTVAQCIISLLPFLLMVGAFVWAGQYLVQRILNDGYDLGLTLAFVWNRNSDKLQGIIPEEVILCDLSAFAERCQPTHLRVMSHTSNTTKPTKQIFCFSDKLMLLLKFAILR